MEPEELESFTKRILARVRLQVRVGQAFLFDGEGDMFWPARKPVKQEEVDILSEALDLVEHIERHQRRPCIGHGVGGRFSVTAFSEESTCTSYASAPALIAMPLKLASSAPARTCWTTLSGSQR